MAIASRLNARLFFKSYPDCGATQLLKKGGKTFGIFKAAQEVVLA
jgi:hypothetical protein